MKNSLCKTSLAILAATLLASQSIGSTAIASTQLVPHRIQLTGSQNKTLRSDRPLHDVYFENDKRLWILGSRNLWLLKMQSPLQLQKIPLLPSEDQNQPNKKIFFKLKPIENGILVLSQDSILHISTANLTTKIPNVTQYLIPAPILAKSNDAKINNVFVSKDRTFWVTDKGIFNIGASSYLEYKFNISPWARSTFWPLAPQAQVKPSELKHANQNNPSFWYANRDKLYKIDLSKPTPKRELVMHIKGEFRDLQFTGMSVVARHSKTVMLFNQKNELLQAIPVKGSRNLISMNFASPFHHYYFSDGKLEIFDTQSETIYSAKLTSSAKPKEVQQASAFRLKYLGLLTKSRLLLYKLVKKQ